MSILPFVSTTPKNPYPPSEVVKISHTSRVEGPSSRKKQTNMNAKIITLKLPNFMSKVKHKSFITVKTVQSDLPVKVFPPSRSTKVGKKPTQG